MSRLGKSLFKFQTVTIPSSGTKSGTAGFQGHLLVGVEFPAAMTGTTITFEAQKNESTSFVEVPSSDLSVTVSAATRRLVDVDKATVLGPAFRLVSDASEASNRTIDLVFLEVD